ncbi:hypothetical protein GCM10023074_45660 [Microbispora amethystogenes]|uniref:Uncharacterized protein n=1 Tax=Microbispora amethystogenes TaxID=1427754 RepID=A0ABQ4FEK5_9ACTN|nr:hypothetical protein Mam01_34200 [Microbispora amethystogenes]
MKQVRGGARHVRRAARFAGCGLAQLRGGLSGSRRNQLPDLSAFVRTRSAEALIASPAPPHAEFRKSEIGGEPATAEPHQLTGAVAMLRQRYRVPRHLAGIALAHPLPHQHTRGVQRPEELLFRRRCGGGGDDVLP